MVKQVCTQLLHNLYSIDYKLLDSAVNKLSITRKTPIRKCIIEHETQQKQNKMLINVNEPVPILPTAEEQQMRDTGMSFASSTRQSLFSPGS